MQVQVMEKTIDLNESGWLEDLGEWNKEVATGIAKLAGVDLTEEHWDLIWTVREYFEEFGVCAQPRAFSKIMRKKYGDARCEQDYIYALFPKGGLLKCINKIAGLPCPSDCR